MPVGSTRETLSASAILVGYDGSDDARKALGSVPRLFPGATVTVLTVWKTYVEMLAQDGLGIGMLAPMVDVQKIDADARERARSMANEGADELRRAGMSVETRAEECQRSVAATVLAVAEASDADAIVAGSRGRGGLKSALLGSVSRALTEHALCPVVIVPSEAVVQVRRRGEAAARLER